ncbi:MAG: hypothetical protein RLZZ563_879 [Pseudomonadota bacterium]
MPVRPTVSLLALAATLALSQPAQAVIILDSTWAENGGAEGAEAEGFDAHIALAEQPQFAAIFGLHNGETYAGSGTWIGNDDEGYGYILTAAHNFGAEPDPASWTYWSRAGTAYQGVEVYIHPSYDPNDDSTTGYDMAIVVLDAPVTDAGPAPKLYAGDQELGEVLTIVGYGSRGIGSVGEEDAYYDFDVEPPAAARNVVDEVDGENGENNLIVDFDSEEADSNVMGDANPIDPLEGILGSGDSGGSAWIETTSGWAIAATNTWGDDAVYGSISGFSRVSTQLDWIGSIFPGFRTAE